MPHRPHAHTCFQWYCVLFGKVVTTVDGVDYALGPCDSILIPPGALRAPRYGGQPPAYLYVLFDNALLNLDGLNRRVARVPEELGPDLKALAAELRHHPGPHSEALTDALVVRLLIGLARLAEAGEKNRPPATPALNASYRHEIVGRAEAFMSRNLHLKLSCARIAAAVHVSAPHLSRIFRETVGYSVLDLLTELRLRHAKRLLLESSLPITRIAQEVGYESFSHFSAVFKAHCRIKPSDYRRGRGQFWDAR